METVCERMKDYGEHMDPSSSRKTYVRVVSRTGEAMDLSEAKLDSTVTSSLKYAVSIGLLFIKWGYALPCPHPNTALVVCWQGQCDFHISTYSSQGRLQGVECMSVSIMPSNLAPCVTLCVFFVPGQCETIAEQNEDELIEFFSHETDNVKDKLCSKRTGNTNTSYMVY